MRSMFDQLLENDRFQDIVHIPTGRLGCATITTDKEHVRVFIGTPCGSDDHNITFIEFNSGYRRQNSVEVQ